MYSLRLFCDINKEKGEKEGKKPLFSYGIIGFPQPQENWNLARRAGGQVVTYLVCGRSCPDPLGIVLWYGKLEFSGFAELTIDN